MDGSIGRGAGRHDASMVLSMCEGKVPLNWAQAKAILDRTPRKGRQKIAYHCKVCRAWHIGNPLRKRKHLWATR